MAGRPVLIVEGSESARRSLLALLGKDGFEGTAVENSGQALAWLRARTEDPCAILLEVTMTAEVGRAFLETVEREFPALFSSLPIIFSRSNPAHPPR